MSEFIKVANISDLEAGHAAVVEIGGRTIALFNVNGEFFALDNTCMHRGGPLGEGFVDQNNLTVQCPWHGSQFDVTTGAVKQGPATEPIDTFDVESAGSRVRIDRREALSARRDSNDAQRQDRPINAS